MRHIDTKCTRCTVYIPIAVASQHHAAHKDGPHHRHMVMPTEPCKEHGESDIDARSVYATQCNKRKYMYACLYIVYLVKICINSRQM